MGFFNKKRSESPTTTPAPAATPAAATASQAPGADEFIKELKVRRTIYHLNDKLPISEKKVTEIIKTVVEETPTSFNSQPVRAVILYGDKHRKLWKGIATDALKAVVPEESWAPTGQKLDAFAAGAGTVLFFEDNTAIKKTQDDFPQYAAAFPIFASHSSGAAHVNVWSALALEKIGGNLQHYSPLIDEAVFKEYGIPADWTLRAQLVFGGIGSPAGEKQTRRDIVTVA